MVNTESQGHSAFVVDDQNFQANLSVSEHLKVSSKVEGKFRMRGWEISAAQEERTNCYVVYTSAPQRQQVNHSQPGSTKFEAPSFQQM